ncbi:DEAD/DEAH box helicase [Helicobacter valdiviensis]|uniref:DEAD/DEAH box helicase n=1 Tax=Helicobacter valdiviensis TaxID=1458358 RepID=A0A2W6PQB8_9HELI|nr:DEAD/DEAH box helicase family protein [Helicobacter valdiviensis]PZT48923.1 DEAD/DEAH box helicase [Helicobacter valdiviensis]
MPNYQEKDLENFIESYLLENNGYAKRVSQNYDKALCFDEELLINFLQSTQSKELDELNKRLGEDYQDEILKQIASKITKQGIVKSLQNGIEIRGIKLNLAYRKPSNSLNSDSVENYNKNTLSIIRQLYYSKENQNSIDIVIFLNGVPLLSIELKNQLSGQNVYNAIEQYKKDRDPKERLLQNCIVHFALDCDLAFMSTKLEREKTRFLPFNRGLNNGSGEIGLKSGAGNPPSEGLKSAYLWEKILRKDILLTLIFDFVKMIKDKEQEKIIFPRYHQFDVVEKLLDDAKANGVGKCYLIEHSAGSGKSNSISWLAHNLVSLHDRDSKPIFDSIIVVTDRKVLDSQIRENVKSFSNTKNLVEAITHGSRQLKEALEEGKKIIITTIQKFPYILDEITTLKSKTFAIIIDEAHSSQSGVSVQKMGEALRDKSQDEEKDIDEKIIEIIKSKKLQKNASYFAFTATPRPKTLEMFGTPCNVNGEKKFIPFHLYSMKQAIEEGFILDVLKGYTTYKSYYKILSSIKENPLYDKKKATKKLKAYVENHRDSIAKKSEIMIDHFFTHAYKKIGARAKAMVVTKSRENALNYYFAFREYLKRNFPNFETIVAFSGELNINGETYSESALNGFSENALKEEFKKDKYKFLIVAEKYQTGFDEPLLHTMYVDKALSGVSAVQTLSRLNRVCKDKEDTFVLDFVNSHEEIAKSFSTFYEQTYLGEKSDDEKIFELKSNLLEYEIYTQDEIDTFVESILNKEKENIIHTQLDRMVERFNQKSDDEKTEFYSKAKTYLNNYAFLAQILPYEDINLEKHYILLKKLIAKIFPPRIEDLAKGILDNVSFDSYRVQLVESKNIELEGNGELLPSNADGSSKTQEAELQELLSIVKEFNEKYGNVEWSEGDKIARTLQNIKEDVLKDEGFIQSSKHSDKQNLRIEFEKLLQTKMQEIIEVNFAFYRNFNEDEAFKQRVVQKMFDVVLAEVG